jgi:2-dehydropantoate 2-reductase
MILPVLNGMRHMRLLAQRFNPHNLVGCALKVATEIGDDGGIVQLTPLQDLAYGELDGNTTPRILKIDAFLRDAKIGARLSTAIHREMWEKWVLLAATGAMTCLMNGTVGEIEACRGGTAFVLDLLDEIVAIVRAVGEAPSEPFMKATRGMLTAKGSSFASSMFRDMRAGRPVEVEAILGDLVRHAEAAKIASPLLSAAYVRLLVYRNKTVSDA